MTMRYDFGFGDTGSSGAAGRVAMFCDPAVVAALGRADEGVRQLFLESGFVLQTCENGAPPGRFPADDEDDRADVIERLSAHFGTHDLTGADWGGFDFSAFMDGLSTAQPIVGTLLAPTHNETPTPEAFAPEPAPRRPIGAMIVLGIGLLLLLYVASQLIL